ncbi:DUF1450 domain-containing protein [Geomicrobium sp. JSM 1781026]|uniref:DUF1450 domain-containing protein n=1 Tax=unclassified Geomicrobium TaxID=2628951 RepID=UPI00045F3CE8|nr:MULTISPECIES: DUF1450 domain-containing protein [unclassified Geomicrobium]GAK13155.1 hypothetical protein JCM19039_2975 [Geomicrobium sp. JCM 19039]
MGIIIVELCQSSSMTNIDVEAILEDKYPEVDVVTNECLSQCGLCAVRPFAVVNGNRVFGDTPEECLEKLKFRIEVELELYSM